MMTLLIALILMQFVSAAEAEPAAKRQRAAVEQGPVAKKQRTTGTNPKRQLPEKVCHQQLFGLIEDAKSKGRVFETEIVTDVPFPENMTMTVTINHKKECGIYAYYARIFGTDDWWRIDEDVSIFDFDDYFKAFIEISRSELGFDIALIGQFWDKEPAYYASEIWHRPSTLSPIYTDEVLDMYDNKKPNLNAKYVRAFSLCGEHGDCLDMEITLTEPGVYGHYYRRTGEAEWKKCICAPDAHYERAAFNSNGTLNVSSPIQKALGYQYRMIGRAESDPLHLEKSKVMTFTNCSGDAVLLLITDTGEIDCHDFTTVT